jgi:hypothetical protein
MPISPTLINVTSDAVIQAYNDYDGKQVAAPDGYASPGASFYGWEGLDPSLPIVAKKFAIVFRSNQDPGQFLVAFRGTETPDEWIANANVPTASFPGAAGVDVESGFLDVYSGAPANQTPPSLQSSLLPYFRSVKVSQLIVTGHSLGGALAALFAFDVAKNLQIAPTLITYASPNVGKQDWADAINAVVPNSIRIYNNRDIVPFLPLTDWGYVPVGTNWPVEFDPQFLFNRMLPKALETNHSMSNYQYVSGHAVLNNPQQWIGTFPDQSTDTTWGMQSIAPAAGTPLGVTLAKAHLDFLQKLQEIHTAA